MHLKKDIVQFHTKHWLYSFKSGLISDKYVVVLNTLVYTVM